MLYRHLGAKSSMGGGGKTRKGANTDSFIQVSLVTQDQPEQ